MTATMHSIVQPGQISASAFQNPHPCARQADGMLRSLPPSLTKLSLALMPPVKVGAQDNV